MNNESTRIRDLETNFHLIEPAQRTAAKVAGAAYLLAMAIVVFATYGIYDQLIVDGNVAETVRNIAAHETLFRTVIACYLIYAAGVVIVLAALYLVLSPANRGLALLAALFRLICALMWVVVALNMFAALRLLSGADYLQAFEAVPMPALVRLHLSAGRDAYYVGLMFWGMSTTLFSYLWFKSKYIPRVLAVFGMIAALWCAASALAFMIFPKFGPAVNLYSLDAPMGLFEIALSLWLLFKGLRPYPTPQCESTNQQRES